MKKSFSLITRPALRFLTLTVLVSLTLGLSAQPPGGMGRTGGGAQMNNGHFYGKVVDENNKGVAYASVALYKMQFDTLSKSMKETLITGQVTEDNGDFSLENLPAFGEFTLKISYLGYADMEQKVSFGLQPPGKGGKVDFQNMASKLDKDLGNIKLVLSSAVLETVTVTAEAATTTLALDKKVYRVDKDASAAGGTAQDALKNVPSLSVDLDGNVSLRNGSPQIFIDGRPSTLTLDQIAADAIESVEVITNPSAKYDASGGQSGIVNIVLKKDRRIGYNGNVRTGVTSRGGFNFGGDVNARQGKVNAFVSANLNSMRGISQSRTDRQNLFGDPLTNVLQTSDNQMSGYFANVRAGIDWFMDNRNTITFAGSLNRGHFSPEDELNITTDSIFQDRTVTSQAVRTTNNDRNFRNLGVSVLFKHLFPKSGHEWTADLNYNQVRFEGEGNFNTRYLESGYESLQRQIGNGYGNFMTIQSDYVNPLSEHIKLETGVRASFRTNTNDNTSLIYNPDDEQWVALPSFADHYEFVDQVYAAYASLSHQFTNWGYQVGLRAESSRYTGELPDSGSKFKNDYPLSLFPSLFITRKLNDEDNIQFSYTRRINRPNFFQLMPFTDFSDSLNLQRGNPDLRPEFTNSFELSYQNIFAKGHNLLVSVYYKQATDLITRYQFTEYNPDLDRTVVVASYTNSQNSIAYGAEVTLKNNIADKIDLTTNFNLYNSKVDASNVENGLVNERVSWFVKENIQIKLPASFSLQLSGEYRSRAGFTPVSSDRFQWHGGPTNTAQGYTLDNWFVDAALKKDLLNRKASLTLNIQDIFRTRRSGTYTASDIFIQDTWRVRDPQTVRLNFSYRFGKMDATLFKRKNMSTSSQGSDMMN
ncbi:MAG TPA: outer membrane beta-barrel family protein [Flavilitoribacter sp.]|nr:outer membrane beta-barrel family protein [Flavilitoribacter sp.]